MADEPHLLFEHDGHTAVVTLNRPEKRNALSSEMLVRMYDAWVEIDRNPDIRVAIVTGAGGNFCSGADLKAMAAGHPDDEYTRRFREDGDLHWKALLRHFVPGKPMIAAVEGYAVAGGTEILQAFDIRVAGESAQFGVAEVRRGLFPLGGSTVRLSRQVPYTHAAELLLTGKFIPAQEARDIGLIGHVVPDGRALDEARVIADQIAENGPVAVQAVLRSLRATRDMPEKVGLAYELEFKGR
jgi:enoyl-CoA hydratase